MKLFKVYEMLLLYYNSAAKASGAGGGKKNQVQGHKNDLFCSRSKGCAGLIITQLLNDDISRFKVESASVKA
jgi:hypothetical protein